MSQTLSLELPDEIYQAVKKAAEANGKPPAEWIVTHLYDALPVRKQCLHGHWLPTEVAQVIQEMAVKQGKPTEELVAEWIARYGPKQPPQLTQEERIAAQEELRKHMGAVSSGDPHSADNARIDADLAREYGSTQEDES